MSLIYLTNKICKEEKVEKFRTNIFGKITLSVINEF